MKLSNYFIAALAAAAMTSCSKEGATDPATRERAAKVKVSLISTSKSKATGNTVLADEQRIDNFVVFLFKADGTIDGTGASTGNETELEISGTTGASSVYVLVNTGEIGVDLLDEIITKEQLLNKSGTLMNNMLDTPTQTGEALWMSGNGEVGEFSDGDNPVATADVQVYFIAAKIKVRVIDERENAGVKPGGGVNLFANIDDISIVDNKIVLLFTPGLSLLFESTYIPAWSFMLTGDDSYPAYQNDANLSPALSEDYTTEEDAVYFYAFENSGGNKPTILAIQSTKTVGNNPPSIIYYAARFTLADLGHTVVRGKEYDVTLRLTGDVDAGGGGGTPNPEEEFADASINVTVNVNEWYPETLGKTFE